MNYLFIPIALCPLFWSGPAEKDPMAHVVYMPVEVRGPWHPQHAPFIFITDDYQPFTHHFLPEDGSEDYFYDEPTKDVE